MSIFQKAKTDGMEEAKDSLGGGGGFIKESNVYQATIKVAYITTTKKGGVNVNIEAVLEDGSNYRETLFVMNENNEVYFTDKNKKKIPYGGYTRINDICMLALEKELADLETETKVLSVYDYESRKDVPREMPVLVELSGAKVALAIQKVRDNKQTKSDDGGYVATEEERFYNNIVAVFHATDRFTVTEGKEGLEPAFWDKWLEKNQNVTYDKYKEVTKRPGMRSGSTSDAPRKSLFAKK